MQPFTPTDHTLAADAMMRHGSWERIPLKSGVTGVNSLTGKPADSRLPDRSEGVKDWVALVRGGSDGN